MPDFDTFFVVVGFQFGSVGRFSAANFVDNLPCSGGLFVGGRFFDFFYLIVQISLLLGIVG